MLRSALRHFPLVLVIIVSFAFVGFALAHEIPDRLHMEAHARAAANASGTAPTKPLDLIRRAQEAQQQLRVETKIQLDAATPGEKDAIMRGAMNARMDGAQNRAGSSSDMRGRMQNIKEAIRQHAGLVKERFALALRQFEKLMARVESRIEKLKAAGVATASVEADLEAAKTANAEAKTDVQAVADFIASVDETADRATVRTELQALIKEAQTSIRTAHQALQKVVKALVALTKESKPNVDASASVEAEATVETTNQ